MGISNNVHIIKLLKNHAFELNIRLIKLIKQPHGRMSTKWASPSRGASDVMGGITGGIQRDGVITGGVPIT